MNRNTIVGVGLGTTGLIGYIVGIFVAYPGRGFTITAVMIGITLVAISHQTISRGDA